VQASSALYVSADKELVLMVTLFMLLWSVACGDNNNNNNKDEGPEMLFSILEATVRQK